MTTARGVYGAMAVRRYEREALAGLADNEQRERFKAELEVRVLLYFTDRGMGWVYQELVSDALQRVTLDTKRH